MADIERLLGRAERSRRTGHAAPVVSTVEEARVLARAVAAALEVLPEPERLLLFANLHALDADLGARIGRLDGEMEQGRAQIIAATRGLSACRLYAVNGSRGRRRDGPGRG